MEIFSNSDALTKRLNLLKTESKSIGFVPTMGALHSGHLALVKQANSLNDISVVSIFVNPTQFNNAEDLKKYPRNNHQDIELLKSINCDILYLPEVADIYPSGAKSESIELGGLELEMEGAFRPGHFDGVATVVSRFFSIVGPNSAYFGEKDFQQLLIIKYMAAARYPNIKIIGLAIERNEKGLALSSRNERLSEKEKDDALAIYQSLSWAMQNTRNYTPSQLEAMVALKIEESELELEYVEIVNEENLKPIENWDDTKKARIFMAAHISGVRLIDNVSLF